MKYICFLFIMFTITACSLEVDHPKITSVYPENNARDVARDTEIQITFSNEMNTNITAKELSVRSVTGSLIEGFIQWDNKNKTVLFTPKEDLTEPGAYTITLTNNAEDKNGVDIQKDFISVFYVSADTTRPAVSTHTPVDKATGVTATSAICITFSEPITLDSIYAYSGISISPAVSGEFSWDTAHTTITFTPTEPLNYGTIYTVTVGEDIADISGNNLQEAYYFTFTVGDDTTRPQVTTVYQEQSPLPSITLTEGNITNGIEKKTIPGIITSNDIIIQFSETITTENIAAQFSMTPSCSYYVLHEQTSGSTLARIVFTAPLTPGERYFLRISDSITDLQSNTLDREYEYSFITNGTYSLAPTVLSVNDPTEAPADQEWDLSEGAITALNLAFTHENIRITFSKEVDPTTIDISIRKLYGTGSTSVTDTRWPDMTDPTPVPHLTVFEFDLVAGFLAGDVYKLTIKGGSSGLQDLYGNYLSEDFEHIFQF